MLQRRHIEGCRPLWTRGDGSLEKALRVECDDDAAAEMNWSSNVAPRKGRTTNRKAVRGDIELEARVGEL